VSYEKQIKDTVIRLTIGSITDVLRAYRLQTPISEREVGYVQGIDDAIKAVQLFLKVLEKDKDQEDNTNE
jgi:hypothetical protein